MTTSHRSTVSDRFPAHVSGRLPAGRRLRRAFTTGTVLGGLLLAGAGPALAVGADGAAPPATVRTAKATTLTVTGAGRAAAAPDLVVLSVGVEVTRKTAKEAMSAQRSAAEALLAALREQAVAAGDIRTDSLSLSTVYGQSDGGETEVTGYQAGQSFSVKVRDIDRAGRVIGAVTDATGDAGRVNGVAFDVADRSALRAQAREAAHRDAYEKASQHARLSGLRLGRLVSLTEDDATRPGAVPGVPADAQQVPLAPGEIEEQVTVTAVYELR
ncbi:SIMPL domain-containing protein [Streptomyces sp. NPDC006551]|uniref:SIMPL domain-containing protein n=1 Tax=Streptomyces sp. NPDC006551 TaxID=3157178 RepID=UPI0033ADBBA8